MPLVPDDQIPPVQEPSPAEAARRKAATAAILSTAGKPKPPPVTDDLTVNMDVQRDRSAYRFGPSMEPSLSRASTSASAGIAAAAAFVPRQDSPSFFSPHYSPADSFGVPSPGQTPPPQTPSFFAPARSTKVEIKAPGAKSPTVFRRPALLNGNRAESSSASASRGTTNFSASAPSFEPHQPGAQYFQGQLVGSEDGPESSMQTLYYGQSEGQAPMFDSEGRRLYTDSAGMVFHLDGQGNVVFHNPNTAQSYIDSSKPWPSYFTAHIPVNFLEEHSHLAHSGPSEEALAAAGSAYYYENDEEPFPGAYY